LTVSASSFGESKTEKYGGTVPLVQYCVDESCCKVSRAHITYRMNGVSDARFRSRSSILSSNCWGFQKGKKLTRSRLRKEFHPMSPNTRGRRFPGALETMDTGPPLCNWKRPLVKVFPVIAGLFTVSPPSLQ
jgi:hypothetical protein